MRFASDAMSGLSSFHDVGVEQFGPNGLPTGVVHPVSPAESRDRFVSVLAVVSSRMISSCAPERETKTILVWSCGS